MSVLKILTVSLMLCLFSGTAGYSAEPGASVRVGFARYPAPSPDGTTLAFSWGGNIWTVPISGGMATRLTSSQGYDYSPVWSPDGSKIAFSSNRFGSDDLFVIDAKGGTPSQITFSSNGDIISGWLPDSSGLIFSTRRGGMWPDYRAPYAVKFSDSRGYGPSAPYRLVPVDGLSAVMHPTKNLVAFQNGPDNGWRQGYRGSHKQDIWLFDLDNKQFTRITQNDVDNNSPMWSADGNSLYFTSEIGGAFNLYSCDLDSGKLSKITDIKENGIWNARVGGKSGAEIVAYERMGEIYVQDISGGSPRKINISAWEDSAPDRIDYQTMTSGATEFALSPDGSEMAFVVRGEIYCVRTDGIGGNTAVRIVGGPSREHQVAWYPRGDSLIFTSDMDGIEQIYRVKSDDPDHERLSESRRFLIERLTNTREACFGAVISPEPPGADSPVPANKLTVAYLRNSGDLWFMDGNGENQRKLFSHWAVYNYSFSPDSRWLAFSRDDDDYNIDILIAAVNPDENGLPECPSDGWESFSSDSTRRELIPSWKSGAVNITRHPDDDDNPVWSPDGTKLGFTSVRNWDNVDSYFVFLKQSDEDKSVNEWKRNNEPLPPLPEIKGDDIESTNANKDDKKNKADDVLKVDIDFRNIHKRARRLTTLTGSENFQGFSPDGKSIIYISDSDGSSDVWQIDWTGENNTELTSGANPSAAIWHKSANRIFFLGNGKVSSRKPGGGDSKTHEFSAKIEIDTLKEKEFKFNEAWRIEQREFYDSNFHGHDWERLKREYLPIALEARHFRDFNDAVNQMFGRLNSSHLWYSDSGRGPSLNGETGYPGWILSEDNNPGLLVESVTPFSPCARTEVGINPGDRIVSINGIGVGGWGNNPIGNYWRALDLTANSEIEIGVIDSDSADNSVRWTRLTPLTYSSWLNLEYDRWIESNRNTVNEKSNGKVGYLHIQRMYEDSLEKFEQDLYTVGYGKEALIIDVRWNSGGWICDWLLAMLDTRRHALTRSRDGGFGYPEDRTPVYTTTIPIVVLCNEYSFSNAEIFTHAIKTLNRGKIVGWKTAGGVISTGSTSLADGSALSLPRRGWWAVNPDTLEILYNLEGNPVIPDYEVELTPVDLLNKFDPQLEKAVSVASNY